MLCPFLLSIFRNKQEEKAEKIKIKVVINIDTNNYLQQYIDTVDSGENKVCKHLQQFIEMQKYKLAHQTKDMHFDVEKANKPIVFMETFCKQSKDRWFGQPIKLMLWQKFVIAAVYGWVNAEGKRIARQAFICVSRKNGKSTFLSGLGLYSMLEKGAQVVTASTKLDAAKITFNEALNMVRQSPLLSKHIRKRKSDMYCDDMMSTFKPLSSKSSSLDGLNVSLAIIDELHAITDPNLYSVLLQSMSAREEPLLFCITTNGFVRENIFDKQYNYATKVLNGTVNDNTFVPIIYELDDSKEIDNEDMWIKANPSLGITKSAEYIREQVNHGKAEPSYMSTVLTKDFDVPQSSQSAWLAWDAICNDDIFNIADFAGSYAIGGVDLSQSGDLTAASIILMHGKQYCEKHNLNPDVKYVYSHYWIPADTVQEKIKSDHVPYDVWHDRGLVSYSGDNRIDYHDVANWFVDLYRNRKLCFMGVYYDEWSAKYFADEMTNKGFDMVNCRQGFRTLSQPCKFLELDFNVHKINYNADPVMRWCLTNTDIISDPAGNIKPVHPKQRIKRIDGVSSMLDAYVGLLENYNDYMNMIKNR